MFYWNTVQWDEGWPPKWYATSQPLVPGNVTLFGKAVFTDIIKDLEMQSPWIIQVDPISSDRCAYKRHKGKRYIEMRRPCDYRGGNWNNEPTKPRNAWSHSKQERRGMELPLEPQELAQASWDLDFRILASQICDRIRTYCFNLPSSWWLVRAAPGHSYHTHGHLCTYHLHEFVRYGGSKVERIAHDAPNIYCLALCKNVCQPLL